MAIACVLVASNSRSQVQRMDRVGLERDLWRTEMIRLLGKGVPKSEVK